MRNLPHLVKLGVYLKDRRIMIKRHLIQLLCWLGLGLFCVNVIGQDPIIVEYSIPKSQVARAVRFVRTIKPNQTFVVFGQRATIDHYEYEQVVNEFFDGWVLTVWFTPI